MEHALLNYQEFDKNNYENKTVLKNTLLGVFYFLLPRFLFIPIISIASFASL